MAILPVSRPADDTEPENVPASGPATVRAVLAKLKDELDRGEYVRAYDTAERARREGLDDPLIRFRRVLALARAGATESAAKEYVDCGLADHRDTDSRALWARILKDRALATRRADRPARLREAADAYGLVHAQTQDYFPAINAATLYLMAGDAIRARTLARELLADPSLRDGAGYWEVASRAEARLILGEGEAAAEELRRARALVGRKWGDLASTRRQLRRLLEAAPVAGFAADRLHDILRPPRVAHLTGEAHPQGPDAPGRRLAELLRRHDVGFAVLALWSEGSVSAAEAALAAGVDLTLVLPFQADAYLADAAACLSPAEAGRRRRCVEAARSVRAVTADADHADDVLVAYAGVVAKGLARNRARRLSTDCIDLPEAATAVAVGAASRAATDGPPERELRALLFADAKGFSKLPESELPAFWSRFMGEMAQKLDAAGDAILYRNTWGDALFCVIETIEAAAEVSLAMQERAAELRREHPRSPVLRIGLHHGPVFRGWDPVRRVTAYFGTQVSRAARVEPIVPPGDVYVTEPFAAVLAATGTRAFEAEYVGVLPLHKDYGEHRMYRLARRWEHL